MQYLTKAVEGNQDSVWLSIYVIFENSHVGSAFLLVHFFSHFRSSVSFTVLTVSLLSFPLFSWVFLHAVGCLDLCSEMQI